MVLTIYLSYSVMTMVVPFVMVFSLLMFESLY